MSVAGAVNAPKTPVPLLIMIERRLALFFNLTQLTSDSTTQVLYPITS